MALVSDNTVIHVRSINYRPHHPCYQWLWVFCTSNHRLTSVTSALCTQPPAPHASISKQRLAWIEEQKTRYHRGRQFPLIILFIRQYGKTPQKTIGFETWSGLVLYIFTSPIAHVNNISIWSEVQSIKAWSEQWHQPYIVKHDATIHCWCN